jgi:hypothetical protein
VINADEDNMKGLQLGTQDFTIKSQHAVVEIVEKIKNFFSKEQHPGVRKLSV